MGLPLLWVVYYLYLIQPSFPYFVTINIFLLKDLYILHFGWNTETENETLQFRWPLIQNYGPKPRTETL